MTMNGTRPTLANKNLERLETYRPGKPVEELERQLGVRHAVKMASNENPFGPSPKALKCGNSLYSPPFP